MATLMELLLQVEKEPSKPAMKGRPLLSTAATNCSYPNAAPGEEDHDGSMGPRVQLHADARPLRRAARAEQHEVPAARRLDQREQAAG